MATKRINLRLLKCRNQALNTGVKPKPGRRERAQRVEDIPAIHRHLPGPATPEAARKPLEADIVSRDDAGRRIEPLAQLGANRILVRMERDAQRWREHVREGQDAGGADDGGQAAKGRDRGCDDVRDDPVDGDEDCPEDFAGALRERGRVEEVDEEIGVDDFQADVAVWLRC